MRVSFTSLGKFVLAVAALAAPLAAWHFYGLGTRAPSRELTNVAENYVKALYSRDFASAYQWISARDREAKSEQAYVREQGSFTGFTLQLANTLAGFIEVAGQPVVDSSERATVALALALPDVDKLAPLVLNWDEEKLNALSPAEQNALLATIDERKKQNEIPFTQANETFDFVRENNQWKILLNWPSSVHVEVKTKLSEGAPLAVTPVNLEIAFKPGEPFTITLKLKNASNRELRARVMHNVEPKALEKYLGVGDCGTFVPFRLAAGKEDENSATFLVWTNLPSEIKRFTMIYEFEVDKPVP